MRYKFSRGLSCWLSIPYPGLYELRLEHVATSARVSASVAAFASKRNAAAMKTSGSAEFITATETLTTQASYHMLVHQPTNAAHRNRACSPLTWEG